MDQVPCENETRIDYVELTTDSVEAAKAFYGSVFGWKFEDWGPDYTSFTDGRLSGGFAKSSERRGGGPLIVIYTSDLETLARRITAAGGSITVPPFEFPGGRRFHFADPGGNVLAVWTDR
jgi:predicted enzyme related to lactoylglutathione lyase